MYLKYRYVYLSPCLRMWATFVLW